MKDLSPRQREILALVAAGRTSKEIAGDLGISESTVNWHLSNVFERLGASSRAEAVAIAMREHGNGEVAKPEEEAHPRAAPSPRSLPVSEIALAFVLTLLLGLIGGAVIAEWDRNAPSAPLSPASAAPSSGASQTTAPTGRPLLGQPPSDAESAPVPAEASPTPLPALAPNVTPIELPIVGPLPALPVPPLPAPAGVGPALPPAPVGIGLPSLSPAGIGLPSAP